ncbi:MAG: PaaI family thioesterase [Campylobacterota bacterium]|nr:PaaI family thioesterase [Campylobacterota bacterium]
MNQNQIDKEDVGFLKYIGGEVVDFDDGYAQLAFEIQPYHKQHLGVVHGGAIATLADHAGWYAVISGLDHGFTSATIEIKINYLKPAVGDILIAEAKVINRTKRTAFVTIEIFAKNLLVAYATGTYAVIDENRTIKNNAK